MTKDRTRGAPYDPSGDKAAGPRGPSAPGSGDQLKEKACAEAGSARMSLLILVSIFLSAALVMFLVYKTFPQRREAVSWNSVCSNDFGSSFYSASDLPKKKTKAEIRVNNPLGFSFPIIIIIIIIISQDWQIYVLKSPLQ
uniref:Uncharacterized protein n=1 Tax=Balaenoptera musculus TaxID=9771 RepID=A0A8C0DKY3_BALMU